MAPPPPPPPPPPPFCLPFVGSKPKRRLSFSSVEGSSMESKDSRPVYRNAKPLARHDSYSTTSTLTSVAGLTFHTDSEKYDDIPPVDFQVLETTKKGKQQPKLVRSNTMTGTKKSTVSSKWGYGWGLGKNKDKEKEKEKENDLQRGMSQRTGTSQTLPVYQEPSLPPNRSNSKSTQASRSTQKTQDSHRTKASHNSRSTHLSHRSEYRGRGAAPGSLPGPSSSSRPTFRPHDSTSTLVGSALDRKINDTESLRERIPTTERLNKLRDLMVKEKLDYYVVPSEDAHGSEYVAPSDKRRQYISGFSGSAGQAIITMNSAYLITDSRYWLQADQQLDENWTLIRAGAPGEPADWVAWLLGRIENSKIGIDGRMLSYENATSINAKLTTKSSKLIYPVQNLIDFIWKDKPPKSTERVFLQPVEFSGEHASAKIARVREWIRKQPPDVPSYTKVSEAKPSQYNVGTLITALPSIAYLLNLRGSDIPFNPLFHAYLFIGFDTAVLFLEKSKVNDEVDRYLQSLNVDRRPYADVWVFLRKREWGDGKLIISPQTSYTVAMILSHYRCTVLPNFVEQMLSVKNETEIEGMKRAYLRDGASYVKFLAWLEYKFSLGYEITEYEAAQRLTEFRRHNKYFMGLAYETISATGPNAALPHYAPQRSSAAKINQDTPYLNDSGGQYRDGTCDTTRTVHFGRPDAEQCEGYTRVLQGHIAIDSAVFPEGTSGLQLDVLARRALWKDGSNYLHGTGHGFGSFLTVHEGSHSFSSNIPLVPGHVITNEPGYYKEGRWGVRIESALVVRRFKTRSEFGGPIWLGFERLTCVPIQTRMVKESMLTKEEKQWLKDHNTRCMDKLLPYLKDDKRATAWLKREVGRGIGLAASGPGGLTVDWG